VLLVDDEDTLSVPYCLQQATPFIKSATEDLQKVQSIRPDLILLDLCLPEREGKEVSQHLREQAIAPISAISVRDDETEKVTALDTGAHDYLTKPFTLPNLARIPGAYACDLAQRELDAG